MDTVQLGNLAEWLAGVGTVGSLGFIGWQFREERERRLREQASQVSVIVVRHQGGPSWEVRLLNQSPLPVYDVDVVLGWESERPTVTSYGTVTQGFDETFTVNVHHSPVSSWPLLKLFFVDANGQSWRRFNSTLKRHKRETHPVRRGPGRVQYQGDKLTEDW